MFDRGDFESYRQQLSLVDWDSLLVRYDIDISTSNITRALIDAVNTNIPNRVITVRKDNPPWLTAQVLPKSADHCSEEYKTFHIGISYY
jgi:hypothetical protein